VTPRVEFRDVGFAYPATAERAGRPFAIRDLSFDVRAGETLGVIGPNASGKTTVIRLLSKVLAPRRGEVRLDGEPLSRLSRTAVAARLAVVPQDVPREFPYSVEQLVLMGRFPHGPGRFFESGEDRRIAREAMAATGVLDLAGETLPRLSGGERQRVMLARALAQQPRLLVLDEPTAHLDLRYQAECVGLLRRLNRQTGLTVMLVSHDLNLAAEVCDRLLLLSAGALARVGAPEEVLEEAGLEAAFGCRVVVDKHPASRRPTVHVMWPDPLAEGGGGPQPSE
jgi:iron complex transport system ATP-binding protein